MNDVEEKKEDKSIKDQEGQLKTLSEALEINQSSVIPFLKHIENFCLAHGGEAHYSEILSLVDRVKRSFK